VLLLGRGVSYRCLLVALFKIGRLCCSIDSQMQRILDCFETGVLFPGLTIRSVRAGMSMSAWQETRYVIFLTIPARYIAEAKFLKHRAVKRHLMLVKTSYRTK
jgi:hypothetical protein